MTAKTTKAIAAHLEFSVSVRLSVQASEAKWKKLTKDYRDPSEGWADQAEWLIKSFLEDDLTPELSNELTNRITADLPSDPVFGLKATKPEIESVDLDDCEFEEIA